MNFASNAPQKASKKRKFIISLYGSHRIELKTGYCTLPNETIKKIRPAFEDERGAIANILEEPVSHIAVITSKKGSIRGNHYHPEQVQYEYLISGSYESVSKDINNKDSKEEKLAIEPGDLVITPPMVAHAMRFLKDSVMLNITTGKRDSNNFSEHTKKYKLI